MMHKALREIAKQNSNARQFSGRQRNTGGENFWARGDAVSTVGTGEEQIRHYIRNQSGSSGEGRF